MTAASANDEGEAGKNEKPPHRQQRLTTGSGATIITTTEADYDGECTIAADEPFEDSTTTEVDKSDRDKEAETALEEGDTISIIPNDTCPEASSSVACVDDDYEEKKSEDLSIELQQEDSKSNSNSEMAAASVSSNPPETLMTPPAAADAAADAAAAAAPEKGEEDESDKDRLPYESEVITAAAAATDPREPGDQEEEETNIATDGFVVVHSPLVAREAISEADDEFAAVSSAAAAIVICEEEVVEVAHADSAEDDDVVVTKKSAEHVLTVLAEDEDGKDLPVGEELAPPATSSAPAETSEAAETAAEVTSLDKEKVAPIDAAETTEPASSTTTVEKEQEGALDHASDCVESEEPVNALDESPPPGTTPPADPVICCTDESEDEPKEEDCKAPVAAEGEEESPDHATDTSASPLASDDVADDGSEVSPVVSDGGADDESDETPTIAEAAERTPPLIPALTVSLGVQTDETESASTGVEVSLETKPPAVSTKSPASPTCSLKAGAPSAANSETLLSLPLDSLHAIASFLTPTEWCEFGKCSKASSAAAQSIFRRVWLHGFRCAVEVVTAWKGLGQHEDAKELAAMYIHAGVPIYPKSLGHSYHTVLWRMQVEAREMEAAAATAAAADEAANPESNAEESPTENASSSVLDRFYVERHDFRNTQGYSVSHLTYLCEKSYYWTNKDNPAATPSGAPRLQRPGAAGNATATTPTSGLHHRSNSHGLSPAAAEAEAVAAAAAAANQEKKKLLIHQHLLDQHKLGRPVVPDNDGAMVTPPISLSSDFFHPSRAAAVDADDRILQQHSILPPELIQHHHPQLHSAAAALNARSFLPVLGLGGDDALGGGADGGALGHRHQRRRLLLQNDAPPDNLDAGGLAAAGLVGGADFLAPPGGGAAGLLDAPQDLIMDNNNDPFLMGTGAGSSAAAAAAVTAGLLLSSKLNKVLNSVDLQVYSSGSVISNNEIDSGVSQEIQRHMRSRFSTYQRRLEAYLSNNDGSGFDECILDFWDEFFPHTAGIQYYDRHTAVPRISNLEKFLTKPCPKAIGVVQCEIERIKLTSRGKGVKSRLFPTYEYRLFIRHRPSASTAASETLDENNENGEGSSSSSATIRRDTVLMVAKNRGRKHAEVSHGVLPNASTKKGSNNYYLYMPQQVDVDAHFNKVNETPTELVLNPNGASNDPVLVSPGSSLLLGRLQSNFIGTEFEIFTPRIRKRSKKQQQVMMRSSLSPASEDELDYDSGVSSDNNSSAAATARRSSSRFSRLSLRRATMDPTDSTSSAGSTMQLPSTAETNSPVASRRGRSPASATRRQRPNKRSTSCPDFPHQSSSISSSSNRHSGRSNNRRAIANSTGSATDGQSSNTMPAEPVFCEEEDGAITYTANLLGSRPRIMDVCIPKVAPDGLAGAEWRSYVESLLASDSHTAEDCRMLNCFRQLQQRQEHQQHNQDQQQQQPNQPPQPPAQQQQQQNQPPPMAQQAQQQPPQPPQLADDTAGGDAAGDTADSSGALTAEAEEDTTPDDFGLLALQNRPPWWNIELGSFVLNFGGRVSVASVKNFQLCDRNADQDRIMLQFGRIQGRHSFTMDYQSPLTAVQAFSIAISSLQSKISFG